MRFLEGFRGSPVQEGIVWQPYDDIFPYSCSQCGRDYHPERKEIDEKIHIKDSKRWLGSSIRRKSHNAAAVLCDDCKQGVDPNRRKIPRLADRRTELD